MDTTVNYQLFSELDVELSDDTISFFKTFIDTSTNWVWPATNLPYTYMNTEELLQCDFGKIINDFVKDWTATLSILKVPPNRNVPWHLDVQPGRRCVLNTPIMTYPKSYTFVTDAPLTDADILINTSYHTYKMPYELKKIYLLNSQRYHTVFNCSNESRYVISFCSEFITYIEAVQYFKDKNLVNRSW